ncbi:MAG: polysaccharide biosynthesis C-terminal domain-containing protein [Gemmataceae bacterium]
MAAGTSFFTGRGETKVVLVINGVGTAVNALFDYLLIFGNLGFELGMAGAGWATTLGNLAAALLTLTLLFRFRRRGGASARCPAGRSTLTCFAASCASDCRAACNGSWTGSSSPSSRS